MKQELVAFLREEEGVTAIEYGLIAGLIVVAIIGALTTIKGQITGIFDKIATALTNANSGS